jgi:hypothetical protein
LSRVMIMPMAGMAMVVTVVQMRSHGGSHQSLARVERVAHRLAHENEKAQH